MQRIFLFGAGGHGRELAWIAKRQYHKIPVEFVVDQKRFWSKCIDNSPVHLFDDLVADEESTFVIALGDPNQRSCASKKMHYKFSATTLFDPSTISSGRVTCSEGSVIMPGCILTTNIVIGCHSHLNIGCRVSHDVVIEDFVTLSPGVHVAGNVHIKNGAFLGINSTVINGSPGKPLIIGEECVVAAGSCVTATVPSRVLVAGVPAIIKHHLPKDLSKVI